MQQWQDVVAELPSDIAASILPPKVEEDNSKNNKHAAQMLPADLSENERNVWDQLFADESVHIDILLESSGLSFGDLNAALVGLDIRDLIRVLPGKHYARRT